MRNKILRHIADHPASFAGFPIAGAVVAGVIISVTEWTLARSDTAQSGGMTHGYTVAVNALLLIGIAIITSAYLRMKERNRQLKLVLQRNLTRVERIRLRFLTNQLFITELASSARRILQIAFNLHQAIAIGSRRPDATDVHATAYESLKEIVNHARDLFTKYTGFECSLSVKLLRYPTTADGGIQPFVFTFFRDSRAAVARRE